MEPIRPIFGKGTLRVIRVSYDCDITSAASFQIPMGLLTEFSVSSWYGLGVIARKRTSDAELSRVANLSKSLIRDPFAVLKRDFTSVWDASDSSREFDRIASISATSFLYEISPSQTFDIPMNVQRAGIESEDFVIWFDDTFNRLMNDSYWAFIEEKKTESQLNHNQNVDRRLAA